MVSFQRMRDELDSIEYKLPVIGKAGCLTLVVVSFFILFIIGFSIGYGVSHKGKKAKIRKTEGPVFVIE